MKSSLIHDLAFGGAQEMLWLVSGLMREEEYKDAFAEFYRVFKDLLERYEEKAARRMARLEPGTN